MDAYLNEIVVIGGRDTSQSKYGVTNASYTFSTDRPTRRSITISNEGATTLWLGVSSNVQPGVSGINFRSLTSGSNVTIEQYTGPLYGIAGGASIAPLFTGVLEIY